MENEIKKLEFEKFESLLMDWSNYLKPLFESEEMYNLYQEFKQCKEHITPKSSNLYKFLEYCPKDNLKLIVIGQDPYPSKYYKSKEFQATGISFDNSNSPDGKLQPSLEAFWNGLSHEFGRELPKEKDLRFLCEQGVLLGNRALNCKLNKTGSFMGKWDFFWEFFLQEIVFNFYKGVPIILLGKDSAKLKKYVFEMVNPVFILDHPSHAARLQECWITNGTFTKCNRLIEDQFGQGSDIIWDKKIYEEIKNLPF